VGKVEGTERKRAEEKKKAEKTGDAERKMAVETRFTPPKTGNAQSLDRPTIHLIGRPELPLSYLVNTPVYLKYVGTT